MPDFIDLGTEWSDPSGGITVGSGGDRLILNPAGISVVRIRKNGDGFVELLNGSQFGLHPEAAKKLTDVLIVPQTR